MLTPRALAMGGAFIGLAEGPLAGHWNPANIPSKGISFSAAYSRPFGINELTESILGYEGALGYVGNSAFAWQQFKTTGYREDTLSMIYSRRTLSNLNIGVKLEYLNLHIHGFGRDYALGFSSGILWQANENLRFGVAFLRVNRPKAPRSLPRTFAIGIAINPAENMTLTADMRKNSAQRIDTLAGCEININSMFVIRMGVHNHPWQVTFGWGVYYGWVHLDYAWLSHPNLDGTHLVSVSVSVK
ncbi:TPA: hypothetical protein EYP66_04465 [Candidatus Poribacteria bacterium]|nr:hypothetical protein [Candidatus Poribacteria bacterium]